MLESLCPMSALGSLALVGMAAAQVPRGYLVVSEAAPALAASSRKNRTIHTRDELRAGMVWSLWSIRRLLRSLLIQDGAAAGQYPPRELESYPICASREPDRRRSRTLVAPVLEAVAQAA